MSDKGDKAKQIRVWPDNLLRAKQTKHECSLPLSVALLCNQAMAIGFPILKKKLKQ